MLGLLASEPEMDVRDGTGEVHHITAEHVDRITKLTREDEELAKMKLPFTFCAKCRKLKDGLWECAGCHLVVIATHRVPTRGHWKQKQHKRACKAKQNVLSV